MTTEKRSNIVLIGMPGAGKSTVGIILAKRLSLNFVDTDVLIQTTQGRALQDIVDRDGHIALRAIEEKVLLGLQLSRHVIATGGSAVYSKKAMCWLRDNGVIIFLDLPLAALKTRIRDFATRGLAKRADQSLADLYAERRLLYERYAEISVDCLGLDQDEVCTRIVESL